MSLSCLCSFHRAAIWACLFVFPTSGTGSFSVRDRAPSKGNVLQKDYPFFSFLLYVQTSSLAWLKKNQMTSTITKFYIVGNLRIILANTLPHDANHIPYMLPSCDFQIFFKTQTVIKAISH